MKLAKLLLFTLFSVCSIKGQIIENVETIEKFKNKLNSENQITTIVLIGDSHIQAGNISQVLSEKFHAIYPSAGRGLIFPYKIANSNGELDFSSKSNQPWITFRSVHKQNMIDQMGALGFVMKNNLESFIELTFKKDIDAFDQVTIYNDSMMEDGLFTIYKSEKKLSDYIDKKVNITNYTVEGNETFPELAAKFNTTTTKLVKLNGNSVKTPYNGLKIKTENINYNYNTDYETDLETMGEGRFKSESTVFNYPEPTKKFILKTNSKNGNLLYGFRFINTSIKQGLILNTIGVNGATYSDYTKYPKQINQINSIKPDLILFSLGTNEAFSDISKEDYIQSITNTISLYKKDNPDVAIILISPTDNKTKAHKTKLIVDWTYEASQINHVAFINQYNNMGGAGYFLKSLKNKQANNDGVHFLPAGYELQAEKIWEAFVNSKIVNK